MLRVLGCILLVVSIGVSSATVLGPSEPSERSDAAGGGAGSGPSPALSPGGGPQPLGSPPGVATMLAPFDYQRGGPDGKRPKLNFVSTDPDTNDIDYHIQLDDNSDFQSTYIDRPSRNSLNMISDGGAEKGDMSEWTVDADGNGYPTRSTSIFRSGTASFQVSPGTRVAVGTDSFRQIFSFPQNASTLSVTIYYHVPSPGDSNDLRNILIYDKTCTTLKVNLLMNAPNTAISWTSAGTTLSDPALKGKELCLLMSEQADAINPSVLYIDDITLVANMATTAGFANVPNPVDTAPFTSGDTVRFQPEFSLADGSAYFWRVRAVDSGTVWSAWSGARSHWIDASSLVPAWGQDSRDQFLTDTLAGAAAASTFEDGSVQVTGASGSVTSTTIKFSAGPVSTSWERASWQEQEASGGAVSVAAMHNPTADANCNGGTWLWATATASASPLSLRNLGATACMRLVSNLSSPPATTSYLRDWTVTWAVDPNVDSLAVKHAGRPIGDGDRLYAGHTEIFEVKVSDPQGGTDVNRVDLWLGSSSHVARWTESTDSFLEAAGGADFELLSDSADTSLAGNQWTIVFEIRFPWNFPKSELLLDPRVDVVDDASNSDTEVFVASSFLVENDLVLRETGLLLHARLDEGSGTIAGDSSGVRHTGTLLGNPVWIAGRLGAGLSFDGVDDAIDHSSSSRLNPSSGLTLEAWFKVAGSTGTDQVVISRWDSAGGVDERTYVIGVSAANQVIFGISADGITAAFAVSPGTIVYTVWYHVAGTWDGSTMRLHVNGSLAATTPTGGAIKSSPSTRTAIGAIIGRVGDPVDFEFLGQIDEARIYDRASPAAEVQERAQFRNNDGRTGLVSEILMDDGGGTAANESSGLGTSGSLSGGPAWVDGKVGKALQFDMTNDDVRLTGLKVNTGAGAWNTVEFWMNWNGDPDGLGSGMMPFGWGGTAGGGYGLWLLNGCFGFNTWENNILGIAIDSSFGGRWHHVAAIFYNGVASPTT
ncbi:MAG TPA: LamG domain-containing protein, partial [Thermoplasmata archaeon]|nr:LamG domain-containing protein [Thermoplasmata archaeon]